VDNPKTSISSSRSCHAAKRVRLPLADQDVGVTPIPPRSVQVLARARSRLVPPTLRRPLVNPHEFPGVAVRHVDQARSPSAPTPLLMSVAIDVLAAHALKSIHRISTLGPGASISPSPARTRSRLSELPFPRWGWRSTPSLRAQPGTPVPGARSRKPRELNISHHLDEVNHVAATAAAEAAPPLDPFPYRLNDGVESSWSGNGSRSRREASRECCCRGLRHPSHERHHENGDGDSSCRPRPNLPFGQGQRPLSSRLKRNRPLSGPVPLDVERPLQTYL
jgi:hypothetical protein